MRKKEQNRCRENGLSKIRCICVGCKKKDEAKTQKGGIVKKEREMNIDGRRKDREAQSGPCRGWVPAPHPSAYLWRDQGRAMSRGHPYTC